ncbi:Lipoprotein, partial [Dysosmobacter welbionis]
MDQQADQVLFPHSLLRGKGEQNIRLRQLQRLPDQLKGRLHLALFQLIQLVGHHDLRTARLAEPVVHHKIVGRGLVADVHDQHAGGDPVRLLLEVALHQLRPPLLLRLGDPGIAVPRQIHQIGPAVNEEVVHLSGLAGGGAHIGKVLPSHQPVDDRTLSHIGPACKCE